MRQKSMNYPVLDIGHKKVLRSSPRKSETILLSIELLLFLIGKNLDRDCQRDSSNNEIIIILFSFSETALNK